MKGTIRSYLSVSQIRKYMTCGMQYYYRYVEGIPEKMGSAVLRGTSVDNAANEHFLKQAQTNKGLTQSQFVDFAVKKNKTVTRLIGRKTTLQKTLARIGLLNLLRLITKTLVISSKPKRCK